jgi:hypothetical protein
MRVSVTHREEISYIVDHQDDEFYDLDELKDLCDTIAESPSRPQCCTECSSDFDFKRGGCPCRIATSSL